MVEKDLINHRCECLHTGIAVLRFVWEGRVSENNLKCLDVNELTKITKLVYSTPGSHREGWGLNPQPGW